MVCIVSFSSCCKLFVLEIKQFVLYSLSVSKTPPVVSPTNMNMEHIRSPNQKIMLVLAYFATEFD